MVKVTVKSIDVADLQQKRPEELMEMAKQLGIENIAGMHKQGLIFVISKKLALDHPEVKAAIHGSGVLEILQDGFGFLRSPKMSTYLVLMIFMFHLVKFDDLIYARVIALARPRQS